MSELFFAQFSIRAQRNYEMKCCATLCTVFNPDPPAIGLDDSARDRQAEPSSMFLSRVESLENLADLRVRDTGAAIDHRHPSRGLAEQRRSKNNAPRIRRDVDHCVHRIRCQVQYDLQQMHGISSYQQRPFVAFPKQDNLSVIGFSRKNAQGIRNHRIQFGLFFNLGIAPALEQISRLPDDRRSMIIGAANLEHGVLYLTEF